MPEKRRIVKRYSAAFKQQIVGQIERGELSVAQAQKRYDIGSSLTIDRWLKSHGKHHLLATVVRIEMRQKNEIESRSFEEQVQLKARFYKHNWKHYSESLR